MELCIEQIVEGHPPDGGWSSSRRKEKWVDSPYVLKVAKFPDAFRVV